MSELTAHHSSPIGSAWPEATVTHGLDRRPMNIRAAQLELLSKSATRVPFAAAVGIFLVGCTAWGHAPLWLIAGWSLGLLAITVAHRSFAQQVLRKPPADPLPALHMHALMMLAAAAAIGSMTLLLFAHLPLERQALLTIIVMCWAVAAASAMAPYARAFYVYVVAALAPLALIWATAGTMEDAMLGALIGMFGFVLSFLARDHERAVRTSLDVHDDNERLIERLARERHEAGLARKAAQSAERAKSRFLAAAGHDLRQPLHALSLYSAAMQLRRLDGDMAEIGHNINQALASLSALVDSLLEVSRLDAGAVRPTLSRIDLNPLLEQIERDMRPLARSRGLELHVSKSEAQVDSDPALLERLVRNLVDNAIKYTVQGSVTVCAEPDDGGVRIAVRDTGPGIAVKERNRIFEEFYQIGNPERDRAHGLGLGLAIVRRLAPLLNVRIELESAPGQGSTFALRMARARSALEPAAAQHPPALERSLDSVAILVIDDEPTVRAGMRTLLASWGCRVLLCGGLTEASEALDRERFAVDVIISDLRLRHHENGIETVRALQDMFGYVPALLVSGDTSPERLREAHASGLPLLHKPVSAKRLREALLGLLAAKPNGVNAEAQKSREG